MASFVLAFILLLAPIVQTLSKFDPINFHHLPGVFEKTYSKLGDINIGVIAVTLRETMTPATACSTKTLRLPFTAEVTEAIAFAVETVNKDPILLPNTVFGFVTRGVCYSPSVALASSMLFLPRSERVCNGSICSTQPMLSSDQEYLTNDVVGVVTSGLDSQTNPISSLYSVAKLPLIGPIELSDLLSNKNSHPYFFRIVPPSIYQVKAILKFISTNSWSYISVLYYEGPYGRTAYENTYRNVDQYGICIATSHMIDAYTNYNKVVADLLNYPRARVVILYMSSFIFRKVLRAIKRNNASGHFILIGSHKLTSYSGYNYNGNPNDPGIGLFTFDLYHRYVEEFYEHLRKQRPRASNNPWLRGSYEYILECSYDTNQTRRKICPPERDIFTTYRYRTYKMTNLIIDAVLTFAHAIHDLLSDTCPDVTGQAARKCVNGELLRKYLRRTSFEGYNEYIKFDENQDVKGKYVIGQLVYDYYDYPFAMKTQWKHMTIKNIAVYDSSTDSITYLDKPITWSHVNTLERIVPWTNDSLPIHIPESVCSRPCVVGEYKIEKEVSCCWQCLKCRENERLVDNNTNCEACPILTWPDPISGYTICIDIPPTYPKFDDTIPIILTTVAIVCLIITVFVFIGYMVYRDERVIKASSKELSVIQLVAIFVGFSTVIIFQTMPTKIMCTTIFFLFCMSFAMLYCPLLVKTIRIVRIFRSSAKNERPSFVSPNSQLIFAMKLIAVQVVVCVIEYVMDSPDAQLTQPIWSEKMVELSCDLTMTGLASFLCYNVVLISLCSIFAFMVRKLPDNFNESKFISMCVSTTLLIWLAFIPSYFTADRGHIRTFLLSTALILNHWVALLLLFVPKLYAVKFSSPQEGNFSNNTRKK